MRTVRSGVAVLAISFAMCAGFAGSPPGRAAPAHAAGCTTLPAMREDGGNVLYIDRDGDGYGVGSPRGDDADDADTHLNTPATVVKNFGSPAAFLKKSPYKPARIYYIAPEGDDRTARADDIDKPFATWGAVRPRLGPGTMAVFRQGRYKGDYTLGCTGLAGLPAAPVVLMAMPGEKAVLEPAAEGISLKRSRFVVFDGLSIEGAKDAGSYGVVMTACRNVTFRHMEIARCRLGLKGMQDLRDILIERCVVHDNGPSHGIYLGSRDLPNHDIRVRECLLYRNGEHGFQHNGRVTNLRLESNVIHSNGLGGISLLEGVCRSEFRNNVIFNNAAQGIIFFLYDDTPSSGIVPYDQVGNTIANNLIWVGRQSGEGLRTPSQHAAIQFRYATQVRGLRMEAAIRDNVLATDRGAAIRFDTAALAAAGAVCGNRFCREAGAEGVVRIEERELGLPALGALPRWQDNVVQRPAFRRASFEDYAHPERFDFRER